MKTKTLTRCALLSACALIIFIFEAQLPPIVPVPGVKLGLANIMTLAAFLTVGKRGAFAVFFVRVLLGSIFTGSMMSLAFSMCGGLLAYAAMLFMLTSVKSAAAAGVAGAIAHNIGQLAAAAIFTKTPQVFYYTPVLMISAVITGLFTGAAGAAVIRLIKKHGAGTEDEKK